MRVTLTLDDELLRVARTRAHEQGVSLDEVLVAALRDALRSEMRPHPPFTMITYGPTEPKVAHEPHDFVLD